MVPPKASEPLASSSGTLVRALYVPLVQRLPSTPSFVPRAATLESRADSPVPHIASPPGSPVRALYVPPARRAPGTPSAPPGALGGLATAHLDASRATRGHDDVLL